MGFNFSRGGGSGGGGGGGIRRIPRFHGYGSGGYFRWAFLVSPSPTSPQFILNNQFEVDRQLFSAFTYATTFGGTAATLSVNSNYWVDLLFVGLKTADGLGVGLSVNGNSISPLPQMGLNNSRDGTWLDVYGYGVTATATFTGGTGTFYLAPALAHTIITSGGSVVWPLALSGQSVLRDI